MRARAMLISALMLCACATSGATPPILVGTEWLRVDDDNASPHYVTIGFTADGASGYFPGCGPWSARVRTSGASLSFSDITPANPDCGAGPPLQRRSRWCAHCVPRVQRCLTANIFCCATGVAMRLRG